MRTLNIPFEDREHKALDKFKGKLSWHDFIILMYAHCVEAQKRGDFEVAQ